jgi:hypothetical protein
MLFAYTYVPHRMEKMQEFIDFIFLDVWCKAPIGLEFHPDLFAGEPDLQEVMTEFGFAAKAPDRGKAFYKDVKAIYEHFALLTPQEIDQLRGWYGGNNDIEKVCANDPTAHIVRYEDFPIAHEKLRDELASFFKGLYSQSLLDLAALKSKIGDIDDHYKEFVKINRAGKCPFCGISDLFGEYHSKREAYDHYLPKALYPFNSINFRNLVPACHHCNSSYKTSKDPAHEPKDPARSGAIRRRVFYPFRLDAQRIKISVSLAHADFDKLGPEDIDLEFGPAALSAELGTWCDVYGVKERYRAKILGENDGKYWLMQATDEWKEKGRSVAEYLQSLAERSDNAPFAECNFLRRAFIESCARAEMLDRAVP